MSTACKHHDQLNRGEWRSDRSVPHITSGDLVRALEHEFRISLSVNSVIGIQMFITDLRHAIEEQYARKAESHATSRPIIAV